MALTLIAAPTIEPITLAEAKLHCRVDSAADDTLITGLIVAARQQAEERTGRALITQQWRYDLAAFPIDHVELPNPPLQSVQGITYLDAAGNRQTLAGTEYDVIAAESVGVALPAYGKAWPACRAHPGSVQISFTAGYGLSAGNVPQAIRQWILLAIGTWYAQREAVITGTIVSELPRNFWDALLDPYRILRF